MADVHALAHSYRDLAHALGADYGDDPGRKNELYLRLHAVQRSLSESSEGQQAIISLLDDPDPWVRLSAASHSLRGSEQRARKVLEALRDTDASPAGFDAKYVLREHDAGRLCFDY